MRLRDFIGPVFACQACASLAGSIALDPVASGEISYLRQQFLFPPFPTTETYRHDDPLTELVLEQFSSAGCLCSVFYTVNGYAIYDAASAGFPVVSASLQLDFTLQSFGNPGIVYINSIDDFTPEELTALPPAGLTLPPALGQALTSDIASGMVLGMLDVAAGSGLYSVTLDSAAVDLINAADGLLAFGLYYAPVSSGEGINQLNFNRGPRLLVSGTQAMPEPGTWILVLAAAAVFAAHRGRHRSREASVESSGPAGEYSLACAR